MDSLKKRIMESGEIRPGGIIKVDSFLNHLMDTALIDDMGREFYEYFKNRGVTKILTVEASGIGIACLTARYFGVPVLFAKKSESKNLSSETYTADVFSYTKGKMFTIRVDRRYITAKDKILLIDDFLANGRALMGLADIAGQAGSEIIGAGICIEKAFQDGGDIIRNMGIDLYSLAVLDVTEDGKIVFVEKNKK
jgi:xanthine phosphoribosyltransferase